MRGKSRQFGQAPDRGSAQGHHCLNLDTFWQQVKHIYPMPTWLHIKQYNTAIIRISGRFDMMIISGGRMFALWTGTRPCSLIHALDSSPNFQDATCTSQYSAFLCTNCRDQVSILGVDYFMRSFSFAPISTLQGEKQSNKKQRPTSLWYSYLHLQQHKYLCVKEFIYKIVSYYLF